MRMAASDTCAEKMLGDILPSLPVAMAKLPITGLCLDSRHLQAGNVFVAVRGHQMNGADFIDMAVEKGAAAILIEPDNGFVATQQYRSVPLIVVDQLVSQVSELAARYYQFPATALKLVGVTGTNGKTTCSQLIAKAYQALAMHFGVLGTLGAGLLEAGKNPKLDELGHTTPDAVTLQKILADWRDQKATGGVMEVSSHGLAQGRVAAVQFEVAVFTNLTRDHLDYHGSMQAYGEAKLKLFTSPGLQAAVINADDEFSEKILSQLDSSVNCVTYGIKNTRSAVLATSIEYFNTGFRCHLHTPWGDGYLSSPLLGEFNVSNVLAAVSTLLVQGISLDDVLNVFANLEAVSGRMQRVASGSYDLEVVVDYAHTPDALVQALRAVRQHCQGSAWCVFGCGGDRDAGKRSLMGAVAEQLADKVVLTSDNPRSELPSAIIDDVLLGMEGKPVIEVDRAAAIDYAIQHAQSGDMILLAGKGHETYQLIGQDSLPFDDVCQARLALAKHRQKLSANAEEKR